MTDSSNESVPMEVDEESSVSMAREQMGDFRESPAGHITKQLLEYEKAQARAAETLAQYDRKKRLNSVSEEDGADHDNAAPNTVAGRASAASSSSTDIGHPPEIVSARDMSDCFRPTARSPMWRSQSSNLLEQYDW